MKSVLELSPAVSRGDSNRRERRHEDTLVAALSELVVRTAHARTRDTVLDAAARGLLSVGLRFAAARIDGENLVLEQTTVDDLPTEKVERVLGRPLRGLSFQLPAEVSPRRIEHQKRPVFIHRLATPVSSSICRALSRALPELKPALVAAGLNHAVIAPLRLFDKAWGLFIICGQTLRPDDLPAITLFSSHVASALEAADVISGIERQNRQLAALDAVTRASGDPDLTLLSERLAHITAEATQSDFAAVAMVDEEQATLSMLAAAGASFRKLAPLKRVTLDASALVSEELMKDPRPRTFLARAPSPIRSYLEMFGVQSVAVLPLVVNRKVRWLLYIGRAEHRPYGGDELRQAEILAGQVCTQLENARLRHNAHQRLGQLTLLFTVARIGTEERQIPGLVTRTLHEIVEGIQADSAALYLMDGGRLRFAGWRVRPSSVNQVREGYRDLPLDSSTLIGWVALQRKSRSGPVDQLPEASRDLMYAIGLQWVAAVPLLCEGHLTGVLWVGRASSDCWRQEELQLLESCAAQVSLALERARLFEQERRRFHDLSLINELGGLIGQHLDLETVLRLGAEHLSRITGIPHTSLLLANAERTELKCLAKDPHVEGPELTFSLLDAIPQSAAAQAFHQRKPEIVQALAKDAPVRADDVILHKYRSVLFVPLVARGEALGVIVMADLRHREFTTSELDRAGAVSHQLASAIANAQLFQELKRSYDELARAQRELVEHERLAALGELAAVVAHEVRNPLGVIFNSLGSLRKILRPRGDAAMLLDIVGEESDRLNRIVGDLLDFAKPYDPVLKCERLEPLVQGAVEGAMRSMSTARRVHVRVEVPSPLPEVFLDARMIRQALVNLVVNALQAASEEPRIVVSLVVEHADQSSWVRINVTDNGPGIPEEVSKRMFEPFFTTKAFGTGLGLAVVKRIMQALRGRVSVDSTEGVGSTFSLWLPLEKKPCTEMA